MSKIFRLHTGAGENIEHWQQTPSHLTDTFINTILDPAGSNAHTQITSIPTPFARMDLVRTAFRFINSKGLLEGNTIYHRMVSDCLDIAEIFFNIEALSDKIEVIEWHSGITVNGGALDIEPTSELGRLINSTNAKHKLLGETLKMYLFQDKAAFNFSTLGHCCLLNYKQGPEIINIIGGTSPATLFFSSANDLSYVDISFGNKVVFDGQYYPLHKRNKDFIQYMFSLRLGFESFSEKFPDLETYLDNTFLILEDSLKETIKKMKPDDYEKTYSKVAIESENNNVEILGVALRTKNYSVPTSADNDFIMDISKKVEGAIPCVLPNEPFNEALKYAGGVWQTNYRDNVPYYDERILSLRTLPNHNHIKYPYLTVSDLLEPYLIKLPFPIDENCFFNGNYEIKLGEKDHCFVLPVKKLFFQYFTTADLQGKVSDGKKMFELVQMPGGVKAILRIPIQKKRYIQLSRLYSLNQFQDKLQPASEKDNMGIILENQFTLAIYPFLKLKPEINPHYRVMFVDRDIQPLTKAYHYNVSFYAENSPMKAISSLPPRARSSKDQVHGATTQYYVIETAFEFIEINNSDSTGLLIPVFKPLPASSKKFKFAIDFGTTNTHIEYKVEKDDSRPFEITEKDIQIATLHDPSELTETYLRNPKLTFGAARLTEIIKEEFIPFIITKNSQYKFPQRTVIHDIGSFNPNEPNFALADFNIPFWYLKDYENQYGDITSNLKWIDFKKDPRFERRSKAFLKQLLIMIRNKVLFNGGDINATEIVWFYPSSMPKYRRGFLQKAWKLYYDRYFPGANKLYSMSESFAPFYYYYHKENVQPHDRPAVSIDIGGGTTDVVIYKSETPVILSSFRFAANAIFGDGYGSTSAANGFVQRYQNKIIDALSSTAAKTLIPLYQNLTQTNSSSIELIEFFFAIENNRDIINKKIPLSFSKILEEDNDMKLVFVLFYASIIYHIACLMKAKGLQVPEFITFSGNGSKVLKLTSGDIDLSILLSYTKVIFEDIYNLEKSPNIEFRYYSNPKEITCKGGLECTEAEFTKFATLEKEISTVLIGTNNSDTIPPVSLPYSQLEDESVIEAVCTEFSTFIKSFFKWNSKFNYFHHFGINPKNFPAYEELLTNKVKNDLISGIKEKVKESEDNVNSNIEETLFFYPLKGAINRLANKINVDNK